MKKMMPIISKIKSLKRAVKFLLFGIGLCGAVSPVNVYSSDWTAPSRIITTSWEAGCDNKWPSIDSDGTTVVYLNANNQSENESKIMVVEYAGGTWGEPELLAGNGHYSTDSFQWLPWQTQPVISANGYTIAYVGYEPDPVSGGGSAQIYIIDLNNGIWGAPVKLNTGMENHHYIVSLSDDGNTIAFASRPFNIFGGTSVMYVSTRTGGVWGSITPLSSENEGGAFHPSLSSDGTKLIWVQNEKIYFSEKTNGSWTQGTIIAKNVYGESTLEYPVISPDGNMVSYWKVNLVSGNGSSVRQTKDLYLIQRMALGWSGARKINATTVVPGIYLDAPAGASGLFNRMIYSRGLIEGDSMNGAGLELAELIGNNWSIKSLTAGGYSVWDINAAFSRDGKTIIYQGSDPSEYGCNAFWAMKTNDAGTAAIRSISGTVRINGSPLSGVTITLSGATNAQVTTDTNGNYGLTGFSDGSYIVTPSMSGFVFTPPNATVTISGNSVSGTDFSAANASGTIFFSGSVLDATFATASPFANAGIELAGNSSINTTSDSNGNFLLAGIPENTDFSIKVSAESVRYLPVYSETINSDSNIRAEGPFFLYGETSFPNIYFYGGVAEGRLIRAEDTSEGVEGAVVACTSTNHPTDCSTAYQIVYRDGAGTGSSASSSDGIYYIYGVEIGDTVTVTATKPGWYIPAALFTARSNWTSGITEIITPGYEIEAGSVHLYESEYEAWFSIADPHRAFLGMTATRRSTQETKNLQYSADDKKWKNMSGDFSFGTESPTDEIFDIAITDAKGTSSIEKVISGGVGLFATNLLPTGSISGDITFQFNRAPGADRCYIALSGPETLWTSDQNQNLETVPYTGNPLLPGSYTYEVNCFTGDNFSSVTQTFKYLMQGDINGSGAIDLADAIYGLVILSTSQFSENVEIAADVDKNGKIGLEDVIFILQKTAKLR